MTIAKPVGLEINDGIVELVQKHNIELTNGKIQELYMQQQKIAVEQKKSKSLTTDQKNVVQYSAVSDHT